MKSGEEKEKIASELGKLHKNGGGGEKMTKCSIYPSACIAYFKIDHQVNGLHSDLSGAAKDSVVDVIGICKLTNDSVNITTR